MFRVGISCRRLGWGSNTSTTRATACAVKLSSAPARSVSGNPFDVAGKQVLANTDDGVVVRHNHPHTRHIRLSKHGKLSERISTMLQLDADTTSRLMGLGAVWLNGKRALADVPIVGVGSYIRVHLAVSRFPRAVETDWRSRIVFENEGLVVVNKPQQVPSHSTVDNYVECVEYQVSQTVGKPLIVVHRLDTSTRGLMVLAKKPSVARKLQLQMQTPEFEKRYLALTDGCPSPLPATLEHFTPPSSTSNPRVFAKGAMPGWLNCKTVVNTSTSLFANFLPIPAEPEPASRPDWHDASKKSPPDLLTNVHVTETPLPQAVHSEPVKELEISLLTGRTHQIRGQLSAVGVHVFGDFLYGWKRPSAIHDPVLALRDGRLAPPEPKKASSEGEEEEGKEVEPPTEHELNLRYRLHRTSSPSRLFGLQAYRLSFTDPVSQKYLTIELPRDWSTAGSDPNAKR